MRGMHVATWMWVVGVGAVIVYFVYRFSGAASNCSFIDAITGKCGAS